MKGVKIKTERVLLFVRSSGDRLCSHLHAAFLAVKAQILFSKTFSHDNTAPERQTGFYISRNLQQQRLLTVVPPQGQTSTLRPLSTILFGLVHSLVLQWEKQGNQKEVRPCKKKEIKYLTFTSAQLSVRVCVLFHTGTEYVSSIWNSAGSSLLKLVLEERRLRNIFSRSMFSPVTFEIWKMGHILQRGRGVMRRRRRRRKAWLLIKILINSTL